MVATVLSKECNVSAILPSAGFSMNLLCQAVIWCWMLGEWVACKNTREHEQIYSQSVGTPASQSHLTCKASDFNIRTEKLLNNVSNFSIQKL